MLDFSRISEYTENSRVEAKTALGGFPESLWETYSAFANTMGGYILLGVKENPDKTFTTVDLPDPEKLLAEFYVKVNDPNRVSANIIQKRDLYIVDAGGDHIAVIHVPRAKKELRPVYIEGDIHNSFVRNGEGDIRLSTEQLQEMIRARDETKISTGLRFLAAIIIHLTDHASATAKEIAARLRLSPSQTRRYLKRLLEKNVVEKLSGGRTTRYRLKHKPDQFQKSRDGQ